MRLLRFYKDQTVEPIHFTDLEARIEEALGRVADLGGVGAFPVAGLRVLASGGGTAIVSVGSGYGLAVYTTDDGVVTKRLVHLEVNAEVDLGPSRDLATSIWVLVGLRFKRNDQIPTLDKDGNTV